MLGERDLPAPILWLEGERLVASEWVECEPFSVAWRRRRPDATPERLASVLLEAHEIGLCHGDFRPRKVLLESEVGTTLIGWSHDYRGDTRLDLARAVVVIEDEYGGALRAPFLRCYRQVRPVDPRDLERFERRVRAQLTIAQ